MGSVNSNNDKLRPRGQYIPFCMKCRTFHVCGHLLNYLARPQFFPNCQIINSLDFLDHHYNVESLRNKIISMFATAYRRSGSYFRRNALLITPGQITNDMNKIKHNDSILIFTMVLLTAVDLP